MNYVYREGTPIDPKDIRAGDVVRNTLIDAGVAYVVEGRVVRTYPGSIDFGPNTIRFDGDNPGDYELIERPKPDLKPGQLWSHPSIPGFYQTIENGSEIRFVSPGVRVHPFLLHRGFYDENRGYLTYVGEAEITVRS